VKKVRVFIADDSIFMRRVLSDHINKQTDMEVVGTAANGREVLSQVQSLQPDVITMDIEMPGKNGLIALQEVMRHEPTPVIMCSTLTEAGADATILALEIGACDFVAKPKSVTSETVGVALAERTEKIRVVSSASLPKDFKPARTIKSKVRPSNQVLLIAASTGGPKALTTLLQTLPKGMQIPAIIIQHMPAGFTASLATRLNCIGAFKVVEAKEGDRLQAGVAYVIPGGCNFELGKNEEFIRVPADERSLAKPSVDVMFRTAAQYLGNRSLATILTGMGKDGTEGGKLIHEAGGILLGECESSCTVYGMSKAAKEAGIIAGEYSIQDLGSAICALMKGGKRDAA
jgi:two-component system, chemotaxis family, protein-glutamate methylesterase/glutaminase